MKVRKILLTILALTMTFAMALGIFAACGEDTPAPEDTTYTVTFRDGTTDVDTVTVNAGTALTEEQIPAAPAGHDGTFLGWYVGTVKVTAGYTPTASVVALASFDSAPPAAKYSVTVVAGDFTVDGLEESYPAGTRVIFTVTPNDDTMEVNLVESAEVTVQKTATGSYFFDMPAKNVTIRVTLQEKQDDGPVKTTDSRIELFMYGELYKGARRSIYAKLHDGLKGTFTFTSLDNSIIEVSTTADIKQGDDMPEGFLWAKAAGKATIRCMSDADESIYNEIEVTVLDPANGTSMPAETYGKLEGSLKLTSTEKKIDFAPDYTETVSSTNDIITIFEENNDTEITINRDGDTANLSDAFQIEVKDHDSGGVSFAKTYVSNQRDVCTEYINMNNEVGKRAVFKKDAEGHADTVDWAYSYYSNIFYARSDTSSPDLWKSFDGGKTYHYVGSDRSATFFCAFLYQSNISPDDMYIEIDGENIKLTVIIDPANYQSGKKYGTRIETTFSEFGTATIEHLQPFEHEEFHTAIETARANMAALKNYKAVATFDGKTYEITYLEDTIDVVVKTGAQITSHSGAHKYGEGEGDGKTYYEYTYDDASKTLTKGTEHDTVWHDGETVKRYPTFVFAAEIFGQTEQDKTYTSRINNGEFLKETCYFSVISDAYGMWDFSKDGTLKLDSSGQYIEEVSTTVKIVDGEDPISIVFSEFGTATLDIEFKEVITPAEPTTWEEGLESKLYDDLGKWHFPIDKLPYVYTEVGFYQIAAYASGGVHLETAAKIETNRFNNNADRDAYIDKYKAALEADGWIETEYTLPSNFTDYGKSYTFYQKEGVNFKVAVGWYGTYTFDNSRVHIAVWDCDAITRQ